MEESNYVIDCGSVLCYLMHGTAHPLSNVNEMQHVWSHLVSLW